MRRSRRASPGTRPRRCPARARPRCSQLGSPRRSPRTPPQALRLVAEALADSPRMLRAGGLRGGAAAPSRPDAQARDTAAALARRGPGRLPAAKRGGPARWPRRRALARTSPRTPSACWSSRSTTWRSVSGRTPSAAGAPLPRRPVSSPSRARSCRRSIPLVAYYRGYCEERLGRSGREDFALASRQSTRYVFPNRRESILVLRRALEVNPADATAHFLLGSLFLSGGQTEEALAEWEKARTPRSADSRAAPQHRPDAALRAPRRRRGRAARVRGGHERGSHERRALPGRRPGAEPARARRPRSGSRRCDAIPAASCRPALVYTLSLALGEAGRFGEA